MDVTLFYTAQLGGDLALLPRLFTYIQQLKGRYDPRALLLDLGGSCNEDVWHCAVTRGRSTLIVLDGMGYHAANIEGTLAPGEREKLQPTITMGLIDGQHSWRYDVPPVRDEGIVVATTPSPVLTLCIIAAQAPETHLENKLLTLQSVVKGQIGMVQVAIEAMQIAEQTIFEMPAGLNPDPTIAASVEFVEDEARYYQKRFNSG